MLDFRLLADVPKEEAVPIYEYRCDVCGHTFEVFQKISDPAVEACERCGGAVNKVMHPVAIHFKGSGFYTTDYGRAGASKRPSPEGDSGRGERGAGESDKGAEGKGAESTSGDSGAASGNGSGSKPAAKDTKGKHASR